MTRYDWAVLLFGTIVIFTASVIQERSQRTIREILDEKCLALRWAVLLGGIFAVVLMGVYGPACRHRIRVYAVLSRETAPAIPSPRSGLNTACGEHQ